MIGLSIDPLFFRRVICVIHVQPLATSQPLLETEHAFREVQNGVQGGIQRELIGGSLRARRRLRDMRVARILIEAISSGFRGFCSKWFGT